MRIVMVLTSYDQLGNTGHIFEKMANWQLFSVVDGRLITGQNPASSTFTAKNLLKVVSAESAVAVSA